MNPSKMLKSVFALAISALAISASADPITFDPTGTSGASGNISNVQTFDWKPGSALADNVNTGNGIATGTAFTTYYQANLGVVLNSNGDTLFTSGTGGAFFTAVAGFGETVQTCSGAPCLNATFAFDASNPVNFFKIYATPASGNNLTGAGFSAGQVILSGVITPANFGGNFALNNPQPVGGVNLDQNGSNDWVGTKTVTGTGASSIQVSVTSVNALYFPDLLVGGSFAFSMFNTSQNLAFNQVDPSRCLANATTDCAIASNVGTYNGAPIAAGGGQDILFQADANQSFNVQAVPEPTSIALVGLALLGAAGVGRRQRSKKAAA